MRRDRRATSRRAKERQERGRNPLHGLSPDEAEAWVDTEVTDLGSAKQALKRMARAMAALMSSAERQLGD